MLPVAILAGGLATRLGPLTQDCPKSLVPINSQPFIHYQLDTLRRNGITDVVICSGHLGKQIEQELAPITDLTITFSRDGDEPLGTAGAIRKALPILGEEFFVLYGDSYLTCDYQAIQGAFVRGHEPALMVVCTETRHPNAAYSHGYITYYDKHPDASVRPHMHHIDYGLSVWNCWAFQQYAFNDLADMFSLFTGTGNLAGLESREHFYTIGTPRELEKTRRFLANDRTTTG